MKRIFMSCLLTALMMNCAPLQVSEFDFYYENRNAYEKVNGDAQELTRIKDIYDINRPLYNHLQSCNILSNSDIENCKELDLSNLKLEYLSGIDNFKNLVKLNLSNNQLKESSLYILFKLVKLESLDLSGNQIEGVNSLLDLIKPRKICTYEYRSKGKSGVIKDLKEYLQRNKVNYHSYLETEEPKLDQVFYGNGGYGSDQAKFFNLQYSVLLFLDHDVPTIACDDCFCDLFRNKLSYKNHNNKFLRSSVYPGIKNLNIEKNPIVDMKPLLDRNRFEGCSISYDSDRFERSLALHSDYLDFKKKSNLKNESLNLDAEFDKVQHITISLDTQTDISCLEALKFFPNLESLTLENIFNEESELLNLEKLEKIKLSFLNLKAFKATNTSNGILKWLMGNIGNHEKLESLIVQDCKIENLAFLKGITALNGLEDLTLRRNHLSDISALSLLELKSLKTLNLDENEIKVLPNLNDLTNLINLDLSHNHISDVQNLSRLYRLKNLNLAMNKISHLPSMEALIKLETLNLEENQISDIENLLSLVRLNSLNIQSNRIQNFPELKRFSKLVTFHIQNNPIIWNIENVKKIRNLPKIQTVYYDQANFADFFSLLEVETWSNGLLNEEIKADYERELSKQKERDLENKKGEFLEAKRSRGISEKLKDKLPNSEYRKTKANLFD